VEDSQLSNVNLSSVNDRILIEIEDSVCSASIKCLNSKSEDIFLRKEHALIGISPFNGYYIESDLR
jgi:hypothetical protein